MKIRAVGTEEGGLLHPRRDGLTRLRQEWGGNYERVTRNLPFKKRERVLILLSFLSAAKPTDQGEESLVLLVVVVVGGGCGGTVFRSPMYKQNGCIQRKLFLKMGASRENFS